MNNKKRPAVLLYSIAGLYSAPQAFKQSSVVVGQRRCKRYVVFRGRMNKTEGHGMQHLTVSMKSFFGRSVDRISDKGMAD